jgi:hypothetical protein
MKLKTTATALAVTVAVTMGGVRPARALDNQQLKDTYKLIKEGYGYYSDVTKILDLIDGSGSEGPDMVAALDRVKAAIISEIRYYIEASLHSAVDASFNKYREILQNPSQTSSNKARSAYLACTSDSNDACDVFFELRRLITDARDITMSHELATDFNTLAVIMGHGIAFKDKYWRETTSWYTWNDRLGTVLRTNYQLVGANAVMCWPGHNPGYQIAASPGYEGYTDEQYDTYKRSLLWTKKFANQDIAIGKMQFCPIGGICSQKTIYCNPSTRNCPEYPNIPPLQVWVAKYWTSGMTPLSWCEDVVVRPTFRQNRTVSGIRQTMTDIVALTGGDEDNGMPGDPASGEFVNPWVDEGIFCGDRGPWAYPSRP